MLIGVMVVSFAVLGWIGTRIYQEMPPIPDRVLTTDGKTLIGAGVIGEGQNVWQTMGGMEVGKLDGQALQRVLHQAEQFLPVQGQLDLPAGPRGGDPTFERLPLVAAIPVRVGSFQGGSSSKD
jgi:hypothetical protein